ncbi:MAG: PHP domain-containing protein [Oscillospiraceae bacterium]|nr:PHP domain-containing protein [Oscillospiraceae bacterium]
MYKYETHLHTAEGSACASSTGAEMARAHKAAGYDGIFVTDHFFNSSTTVPRELPWDQRIDLYCKGFENALEEGKKIGLDVFFGVEWTVRGADFLIYNKDKQWLKDNKYLLMEADERELFDEVRKTGGFIVHAHPFREAEYIPHISLYPHHVDAVEVVNTRNGDPLFGGNTVFNDRAKQYAVMYGLPETGGSDTHNARQIVNGGILVPEKINSPEDYLRQIKNGSVVPLIGDFSKETSE